MISAPSTQPHLHPHCYLGLFLPGRDSSWNPESSKGPSPVWRWEEGSTFLRAPCQSGQLPLLPPLWICVWAPEWPALVTNWTLPSICLLGTTWVPERHLQLNSPRENSFFLSWFLKYIYWLCYYSCPIPPPHSTPSCPPPPSHIPPL